MLDDLVLEVSKDAKKLIDAFFPGPLTLIFKKKPSVSDLVTANQDTVAIRMPESEIARAFISLCGTPLVAPSANLSGKPSATSSVHVYEDFNGLIPLIIEGAIAKFGIESTILDLTKFPYTILRPGVITLADIESVLGMTLESMGSDVIAPGMRYPHYEPIHPLYILKGSDEAIIKFMKDKKDALFLGHHRFIHTIEFMIDMGDTVEKLTHNLYKTLRDTSQNSHVTLYTHEVESDAYMNRLLKAANYKVINV
jgi:L-threonylcarbamoyladenylate synthase